MDKTTQKTMFSSKTVEWETPVVFFNKLNEDYGFTLDPCATSNTAKCPQYFTKDDDGLSKDWGGNVVFMNPPYGRVIKDWVRKAWQEGTKPDTTVVCLVPARTDTRWWHDYCMKAEKVYFVKGRLKFGNSNNSAPFPSAVVVFNSKDNPPSLGTMGS